MTRSPASSRCGTTGSQTRRSRVWPCRRTTGRPAPSSENEIVTSSRVNSGMDGTSNPESASIVPRPDGHSPLLKRGWKSSDFQPRFGNGLHSRAVFLIGEARRKGRSNDLDQPDRPRNPPRDRRAGQPPRAWSRPGPSATSRSTVPPSASCSPSRSSSLRMSRTCAPVSRPHSRPWTRSPRSRSRSNP